MSVGGLMPWGVAVVIARWRDDQLEVVAIECTSRGAPERWSLPGGKPEHGETLEQAARREAREECGFEPGELLNVGVVRSGTESGPCMTAVFFARDVRSVRGCQVCGGTGRRITAYHVDHPACGAGTSLGCGGSGTIDQPTGSPEGEAAWRPFRQLAAGPYAASIRTIANLIGYPL